MNSNSIPNEKTPGPKKPAGPEIFKNLENSGVAERSYLLNSSFISPDSIKMPIRRVDVNATKVLHALN